MVVINRDGKDLELILDSICDEFNVSRNDFYYNYNESKNGLFNKNVSISVNAILKKDLLLDVKEYLEELLSKMNLEVNFESKLREDTLYIKIYSSNNPVLIGRGGNTLKALENIVRQRVSTLYGVKPYISLDVENYKEKQEKRLERLAKNLAKEVVKTNVEVHLDDMNAYDRRIIHNALTNFKGIKTESTGEEPNRHVVIKPE